MENDKSSPQETSEIDLIAEGRRAMACKDYSNAVEAFQEACQLVSAKYGPVSEQMGDPSFLYGRALLELARVENTLFGGGMAQETKPDDNNEDTDDSEEEEEEESNHTSSGADDHAPLPVVTSSSLDNERSSQGDDGVGDGGQGDEQKGNGDNDDPSNLQLAWEMFEVARVIYLKSDTVDGKLRLADINSYLGEVSLESDQYEQAIEDLTSSLKIRELVLKDDDRLLAESHFQLGLAHTYAMNFDDAIVEYEKAIQVLKLRKEVLENRLQSKDEKESTEKIKEEISEIDELLPDIESKISDVYEIQKKAQAVGSALEQDAGSYQSPLASSSKDSGSSSQALPVNDISHLVRKKGQVNGTARLKEKNEDQKSNDIPSNKRKRLASDMDESSDDTTPSCEKMKKEAELSHQAKKSCVDVTEQ